MRAKVCVCVFFFAKPFHQRQDSLPELAIDGKTIIISLALAAPGRKRPIESGRRLQD